MEKAFQADLLETIREVVMGHEKTHGKLQSICSILREAVPHYDWVGFYLVDAEEEDTLVLEAFAGEPTEHVRIPFGSGICGQAADTKKTFVVQDVSEESSYLSCSVNVKSEIVVPIMKGGTVVGELDIDSHSTSPFTAEDEQLLAKVCQIVGGLF